MRHRRKTRPSGSTRLFGDDFSKDGAKVADGMTNDGSVGTPDLWSIYLAMPDATKAVELAEAKGGAVYVPAMEVMSLGSMAVVAGVGGASIGVWQPGEHKVSRSSTSQGRRHISSC